MKKSRDDSRLYRPGGPRHGKARAACENDRMKLLDLDGRTAVVIGGTSGLGREIAIALAHARADVIPTGRRADLVDQVCSEIEKIGCKTFRCPVDVLSRSSVDAL